MKAAQRVTLLLSKLILSKISIHVMHTRFGTQDSISNQVAAKAAQRVTLLLQQTPPVKKFNIAYDAHNTSQDSINSQVVVKAKLRGCSFSSKL